MMQAKTLVDPERIREAVVRVRGQNVLLDADLAALYEVDVRVLNQAVARNADRFPSDFMFVLTATEARSLRSQIVILKSGRGQFRAVFQAIRELMKPPRPPQRTIGFRGAPE